MIIKNESPSKVNKNVKQLSSSSITQFNVIDNKDCLSNDKSDEDNYEIIKHRLKNNNTFREGHSDSNGNNNPRHKYVVSEIQINKEDLPIDYSIQKVKNGANSHKSDIIIWPLGEITNKKMEPIKKKEKRIKVLLVIFLVILILAFTLIIIFSIIQIIKNS